MGRLFEVEHRWIIDGYHKVTQNDIDSLSEHYSALDKCLYLHSPSGSLGYWNMGNYQFYVTSDCDIPIVQKYVTSPKYFITAPGYDYEKVDYIYRKLIEVTGMVPVITEVDEKFMTEFMSLYGDYYTKTKVAGEFLYDSEKNAKCEGSQYTDMRYRFKKFMKLYPELECRKATKQDVDALIVMLNKWNQTQGKKYFRSTIGRDKRFLASYVDTPDMLCNVICEGNKIVGYCTMEKAYKQDYGILVSAKALPEYKEAGYYLWHESFKDAVDMGIKYVNAAGSYGKGVKEQKNRWRPIEIISTYNIVRKDVQA